MRLFVGTNVVTVYAGGDSALVWTKSQFVSTFGKKFNSSRDSVYFMNGDAAANDVHVDGASFVSGSIYATINKKMSVNAQLRVNYIIAMHF